MQPVANLSSKGSWHVIKKWQVAYISEHLAPAHTCRAISQGASGLPRKLGRRSIAEHIELETVSLPSSSLLLFTSKTSKTTNKANVIYCLTNKKGRALKSI